MENQTEDHLISVTLRSLYRFLIFSKNSAFPNSLFEMEKQILKNRLSKLNLHQIKKISLVWHDYIKNAKIQETIDNVKDALDFEIYLSSIN